MDNQRSTTDLSHGPESGGNQKVDPVGKVLVWCFALVVLAFGLLLFGDLLLSPWR